jgi:hypothetical protein
MLPEPRYVVTELTGFLGDGRGPRALGLSCHVIDTHVVCDPRLGARHASTRRG